MISYADHVLDHPINNHFNISRFCHLIKKLKSLTLQSVIRVLFIRTSNGEKSEVLMRTTEVLMQLHASNKVTDNNYGNGYDIVATKLGGVVTTMNQTN